MLTIMKTPYMTYPAKGLLLITVAAMACSACESLDNSITEDPYGGGKEPIEIKLLPEPPKPEKAYPGETVVFKAKGLNKLVDNTTGEYGFKFFINEVETPVQEITDSTLTVVVPENLSSGVSYLVAKNQVFYGPSFTVLGNLTVDEDFKLSKALISGTIYGALESKYSGATNNYYLVGGFTSFNANNGSNRHDYGGLIFINEQGDVSRENRQNYQIDKGFVRATMSFDETEYINSINYFSDGRMLLSGSFTRFYSKGNKDLLRTDFMPANNIVIVDYEARPDTVHISFNEIADKSTKYACLSRFNGGTNAPITRSFVTSDQRVIGVGNFEFYSSMIYGEWYARSEEVMTPTTNVFRADADGTLDMTYRNREDGFTGADNGAITDAYQDADDGIVIIGSFSSFDGVSVPGIVRLDRDGNVDRTFLSAIGSGPDGSLASVNYNAKSRKAILSGAFSSFNGHPRNGLAVINIDGTLDDTFVPREVSGGGFDFATILNTDKIVASGSFRNYDGVPRQGFVVLEMDGEAVQKYNVPGEFSGEIKHVVETVNSIGSYALLILGDINRFNGKAIYNSCVMLSADFSN